MGLIAPRRRPIAADPYPLPTHRVVARGLLTDLDGRVLIVASAQRGTRQYLPGGKVEIGESPQAACRRELAEEIGVDLVVGELLVCAWNPDPVAAAGWDWLSYLFDCGTHDAGRLDRRIVTQPTEISDCQWVDPGEAVTLLEPGLARLLLAARSGTRYVEYTPPVSRRR